MYTKKEGRCKFYPGDARVLAKKNNKQTNKQTNTQTEIECTLLLPVIRVAHINSYLYTEKEDRYEVYRPTHMVSQEQRELMPDTAIMCTHVTVARQRHASNIDGPLTEGEREY
jgi:hypothetical protein